METLLQNLNYIIAFACALLALHIFNAKPADKIPSLLLGATFLILAQQSLLMNVVAVYGRKNVAGIVLPCFALLIGPLFFLTFRRATKQFAGLRWGHILHTLPAIAAALMLIYQRILMDIDLLIIASFLSYSALLWRMVFIGETQFTHLNQHQGIAYQWLVSASVVMLFALISELLILNDLWRGYSIHGSIILFAASLIKLVSLCVVLYCALQSPTLFEWVLQFGNAVKRQNINPEYQQKLHATANKFLGLVDSQKVYANENVNLKSVAQQLDVPARLLSEAINLEFNQSFSKYMNMRRVAQARRLLETSDLSVTQLMYEVGFRTKSNFNKEFRDIEGMSPSEYRESLKG